MHKRSLIKLFTQSKLSTPVIFSLRHFGHLFHRIKTPHNSIHQPICSGFITEWTYFFWLFKKNLVYDLKNKHRFTLKVSH